MVLVKIVTPSKRTETNTEVTRWNTGSSWTDSVWDDLIRKLQKLFETRNAQFFISWFDGEDYCSIRDVNDLQEAVECMQSEDTGSRGCRIYASPERKEHHTIFGLKPMEPTQVSKESEPSNESENDQRTIKIIDPVPLSQWEMLNLDSDEGEVNTATEPEKEVSEEKEKEEDKKETPEPPPAVAAIAPVENLSGGEAMPVAPDDAPAIVSAVAPGAPVGEVVTPATVAPQPGQPVTYLTGVNPYIVSPYYGASGTNVQPMFLPQWPTATMTPMMYPGMEYGGVPTQPHNMPSAPEPPAQPNTPDPVFVPPATVPSKSATKDSSSEQPTRSKQEHNKKDRSGKAHYMPICLNTLRAMGYNQDEKTLKRLIRKNKGNLNTILDELNHVTNEH